MKTITFISDTHGLHDRIKLSEGFILCHSGDYSNIGSESDAINFLKWFSEQKYEHKIFISGNHDGYAYENPKGFKELLTEYPDVTYLEDSFVIVDGLKIYGSPWSPAFFNWYFMKDRDSEWVLPIDADILLTHTPPFGLGDHTVNNDVVGDLQLLRAISDIKDLRVHAFGHIHEAVGTYRSASNPGVLFINASSVNRSYQPVNDPLVLDFDHLDHYNAVHKVELLRHAEYLKDAQYTR